MLLVDSRAEAATVIAARIRDSIGRVLAPPGQRSYDEALRAVRFVMRCARGRPPDL